MSCTPTPSLSDADINKIAEKVSQKVLEKIADILYKECSADANKKREEDDRNDELANQQGDR